MNERDHFVKFRNKHEMSVAQNIERPFLTRPNGNGKEEKHLPSQLPFWLWLRESVRRTFGQGWEYIVVNKSVDSITMPKWVASAILIAVLGFGASSWWRASDQRDMLIELRTELRLAKEREVEKTVELKSQANLNKVYIDNMTNQLNVIKGMLSQQQQIQVDRLNRGEH